MARPLKEINWDYVERLVMAGCKAVEIYPELGINENTFYYRFKDYFGESFQDYHGKLHSIGHGKIRLTQFEKALDGNSQMLMLLGEEWLGQRKQSEQTPPKDSQVDNENIEMDEKHKLRQRIAELEEELDNKSETGSEL